MFNSSIDIAADEDVFRLQENIGNAMKWEVNTKFVRIYHGKQSKCTAQTMFFLLNKQS